jgi:MFS family permease
MFISFSGTWIQAMAQNWLVFELSKSSFILGLVGFVGYAPMIIFSLFTGVLVDRVNKRKLLIITQIAFMICAFLIAVLTQFNVITIGLILLISLVQGAIMSLDAPARQAIVFDLVGKNNIMNAIALNSIAFHSARMLGPALAGIFVVAISIAGCFYINAISYLAFIVALFIIRPKNYSSQNNDSHFVEDLKSGINFIKTNRIYLILISIVGLVSLFASSYVILLPVFSKEILNLNIKGYGFLMSAAGIGSLLAGLMLAALTKPSFQPKILKISLCVFSLSLISFSLSRQFVTAILFLILAGFSSLSSLAVINSLVQTMVPNEFRGRIMSIYMLVFTGTMPFGSLFAGSLSHYIGVSRTLLISGLVCLALFLGISNKIFRNKEIFINEEFRNS